MKALKNYSGKDPETLAVWDKFHPEKTIYAVGGSNNGSSTVFRKLSAIDIEYTAAIVQNKIDRLYKKAL